MRREFKLSVFDHNLLSEARAADMAEYFVGALDTPKDEKFLRIRGRYYRTWVAIGASMGFDPDTIVTIRINDVLSRHFSAEPVADPMIMEDIGDGFASGSDRVPVAGVVTPFVPKAFDSSPGDNIKPLENARNVEAIKMCEGVLQRLKAGDSVAFAYVEVMRGHNVATGYSGGTTYHLLNSGAARLAHRIAASED